MTWGWNRPRTLPGMLREDGNLSRLPQPVEMTPFFFIKHMPLVHNLFHKIITY